MTSSENYLHNLSCNCRIFIFSGQCRAIYDYTANMYDELSIKYGDIINIHHKQEDGWWVGECDNTTGIFPATYVETI